MYHTHVTTAQQVHHIPDKPRELVVFTELRRSSLLPLLQAEMLLALPLPQLWGLPQEVTDVTSAPELSVALSTFGVPILLPAGPAPLLRL